MSLLRALLPALSPSSSAASTPEDLAFLEADWASCWTALAPGQDGRSLCLKLCQAYGETQRHYHTLQHLAECLRLAQEWAPAMAHPAEVQVALWFHDAVYEIPGRDNEGQSAQWAREALTAAGVHEHAIGRITQHIQATRHDGVAASQDAACVVDIDLAILGASPERFAQYEQQIRQEYRWVPDLVFQPKRREVLHGFLARPRIYTQPQAFDRFEARARANLAQALARR